MFGGRSGAATQDFLCSRERTCSSPREPLQCPESEVRRIRRTSVSRASIFVFSGLLIPCVRGVGCDELRGRDTTSHRDIRPLDPMLCELGGGRSTPPPAD